MPKINTDKPLPDPILSLLVAADQCCPAIIGQAHLLYYSGGGINRGQAAKTFAQLKRMPTTCSEPSPVLKPPWFGAACEFTCDIRNVIVQKKGERARQRSLASC